MLYEMHEIALIQSVLTSPSALHAAPTRHSTRMTSACAWTSPASGGVVNSLQKERQRGKWSLVHTYTSTRGVRGGAYNSYHNDMLV